MLKIKLIRINWGNQEKEGANKLINTLVAVFIENSDKRITYKF